MSPSERIILTCAALFAFAGCYVVVSGYGLGGLALAWPLVIGGWLAVGAAVMGR